MVLYRVIASYVVPLTLTQLPIFAYFTEEGYQVMGFLR